MAVAGQSGRLAPSPAAAACVPSGLREAVR